MDAIIEHEQFDLFTPDRLPRKPWCTDSPLHGVRIRSLHHALKLPYLQINPPTLRFWMVFDIDREGAASAWENANLPCPAWAAVNRMNGHAHLAYGLSAPVLVADNARQKPMRFLAGIESAYREALHGDVGYSGLITKNPTHPLWRVLHGYPKLWDLHELAEYGGVEKHIPKRKNAKELNEYGVGRNVTVFEHLRHWAYRQIRAAKERGNFIVWQTECYHEALKRNGDFPAPMFENEVWHIAKSVSKWTWRRFDIEESDRKFRELQAVRGAAGGKASGLARQAANEDKRASARLMAAQGMAQKAIAESLGVTARTLRNWFSEAETKP